MPGPIIATTDFQARADRAVDRAIMLGSQLGSEVILFHARDIATEFAEGGQDFESRMREVLPAGDEKVQFACEPGSPPQAISEYAEAQDAAVILMGVARYNSLGDFILGTTVDAVIRRTSRPVLVVKKRPRGDYRTIAVATDFSSYSLKATEWAAAMFPAASVHVVHAFHVPYAAWNRDKYVTEELRTIAQQEMASFVADLSAETRDRVTAHIEDGAPDTAVNRVIAREGADLAVLGSHGETGFRHATIGSQANVILSTTPVDTVVVGPKVAG